MNEERLNSFEDFISAVHRTRVAAEITDLGYGRSELLFRGQSDSNWKLETTLERYSSHTFNLEEYDRIVRSSYTKFKVFTEEKYQINEVNVSTQTDKFLSQVIYPNFSFMLYLKHVHFPSPLLEWSLSPYIALYFAYESVKLNNDVAIYVYKQHLGRDKPVFNGEPKIDSLLWDTFTHKRHFQQQAQYTICTEQNNNEDATSRKYYSHEKVFQTTFKEQDLWVKFILPGELRQNILNTLQEMNINAYTLFSSEEGLAKSLAHSVIDRGTK